MRYLITGITGLLGQELERLLTADGHEVIGLSRSAGANRRQWDTTAAALDPALVEGFDVVFHLAGENIGEGRWTKAKKSRIYDSRAKGTALLATALAVTDGRPTVLVSSSAVGYYGTRGDEWITEETPRGTGFLAGVCAAWEAAAAPARDAGIRVVHTRVAPVLSTKGGALAKMLGPFKMGLGGVVGSGDQYMSWIALPDAVRTVLHVAGAGIDGPINVGTPTPVTNREFTETLGRVLHRPTAIPLAAFAARLALGEMADELLLVSHRLSVERLAATRFTWEYGELEPALRHLVATHT